MTDRSDRHPNSTLALADVRAGVKPRSSAVQEAEVDRGEVPNPKTRPSANMLMEASL